MWIIIFVLGFTLVAISFEKVKKKNSYYISCLKIEINDVLNKLSSDLKLKAINMNIQLDEKGLLNSGAALKIASNIINKTVDETINEISKILNDVSYKFNNNLKEKENEEFCNLVISNLCGIVQKYFDELTKERENLINSGSSESLKIYENSLKQNINGKVKRIFQKYELLNSGKKVEKIVTWDLTLSIIGLILSVISIYMAWIQMNI